MICQVQFLHGLKIRGILETVMKHLGFAIIELVFVIAFLALIVAVVIIVVDPLERARQSRDESMRADSMAILQALEIHLASAGKLPWVRELESTGATPQLAWTIATSPNVGLGKGFLSQLERARESDKMYIAKGRNPQDKIYACFVPESQETRRSIGKLYQLEEGKSMPPSGVPESCSENVSWQDEDVCYVCVTK